MNSKSLFRSVSAASTLWAVLTNPALVPTASAEEPYATWAKTSAWGFGGSDGFALTSQGGTFVSTSGGSLADLRLLKFDAQGRLLSSNLVSVLPGQMTAISGIATDSAGATFLAGWGGEGSNAFSLVKLNVNGELVWASRESAPLSTWPYNTAIGITPDALGNLWVVGVSQGPMTFGTYSFGDGGGPVLCKLDPNGQVLFARRIETTAGGECYDVTVDSAGNVLISGFLGAGSADFGGTTVYPGQLQDQLWGDNFIAKYDSNGNLLWVRLAGVTEARVGYLGMSIAVDHQGNIYFLESGLRLGKLSPGGDMLWEKQFSDAYLSRRQGIAVDASDQPVFTGSFSGTVSFDDVTLVSKTTMYDDLFIAKTDTSGHIQWAMRGGGGLGARGHAVLLDHSGNIFLSAETLGSGASFDGITLAPRPGGAGAGYGTIVVAKISERPLLRITNSTGSATVTYPAKATNYVLEASTSLSEVSWGPVTNAPTISGRDRGVQQPAIGNAKFFRLRRP